MENVPNPSLIQEEVNPYAPPMSQVVDLEAQQNLADAYETASKMKRFLNWVIDRVAIMGLLMVVGVIFAVAEELGYISGFTSYIDTISGLEDIIYTSLFSVIYYWTMESLFGRTLGKLITGTKVITDAGGKPSAKTVLGRTFTRIVPFEPFSMFGDRAWHDGWSGTQVIDLRKKIVGARSQITRPYFR